MIDPKEYLPIWLKKPDGEDVKIASAFNAFWNRFETTILSILDEIDPKVCTEISLGYHAWENNVIRLPGETIESWRSRVDNAMSVLDQAGSKKGLKVILDLYGLKIDDDQFGDLDWDMVVIAMDTTPIDSTIMTPLLEEWGRLCRRYVFSRTARVKNYIHVGFASQVETQFTIKV